MTTWFTITPENALTAFATEQEARDSECRFAFADAASLETILEENDSLAQELWNSIPGNSHVDGPPKNAAQKIWRAIQPLARALATPAKTARVRAQGAVAAAKAPKSSKKAAPAKNAPRGKKKTTNADNALKAMQQKARLERDSNKRRAAKTTPAGDGPFRADSKAAQLVEMLRKDPATLPQIMKRFGWLAHTTRALLSAGGSLAKKGIVVVSEKTEGGDRTYRIAS